MLVEIALEVKLDLYVCFIDYSKALDKVRRNLVMEIKIKLRGKEPENCYNIY